MVLVVIWLLLVSYWKLNDFQAVFLVLLQFLSPQHLYLPEAHIQSEKESSGSETVGSLGGQTALGQNTVG